MMLRWRQTVKSTYICGGGGDTHYPPLSRQKYIDIHHGNPAVGPLLKV